MTGTPGAGSNPPDRPSARASASFSAWRSTTPKNSSAEHSSSRVAKTIATTHQRYEVGKPRETTLDDTRESVNYVMVTVPAVTGVANESGVSTISPNAKRWLVTPMC